MAQRTSLPRAERSLLARCRRLEAAALQTALYRHADDVYERLVARLRDRGAADAAFEEVFRRFLGAAPGFNGTRTVLDHLQAIADGLAPASESPQPAERLAEAEFVDLVPRAELVVRVENILLEHAPDLARSVQRANRRVRRQVLVAGLGVLIVLTLAIVARVTNVPPLRREWDARYAAEAVIERELTEAVGEWTRREGHAPLHGDARRRDLAQLELVLEEIASLHGAQQPVEMTYIVERLRRRDLIDLADSLAQEATTASERRDMATIAQLLEEVSAL